MPGSAWLGRGRRRLYITVHHTDEEARRLWRELTGIADRRIYGLGDTDNFWQMADTGPAGPNSEIYVGLRGGGDWEKGQADLSLEEVMELQEGGAPLEVWDFVFLQYDPPP